MSVKSQLDVLNVQNCFRDSPEFRAEVLRSERKVTDLEVIVKNMLKSCKQSIELSHTLSTKNQAFITEMSNLASYETGHEDTRKYLKKFAETFTTLEKSRVMMLSQLQEIFVEHLEVFLTNDIKRAKESKKSTERACDESYAALDRYLAKREKDPGVLDAADEVQLLRHTFHNKAIDHCILLNKFHLGKRNDFLENILGFIQMNFTFYHQGYETFKDIEPFMREMSESLGRGRNTYRKYESQSQGFKDSVLNESSLFYNPMKWTQSISSNSADANSESCTKSGYLMKRGSGKIAQVWSRRWFSIRDDCFIYCAKNDVENPVIVGNLMLCSVRSRVSTEMGIDRRNCFELITPMKVFVLQTENEKELSEWVKTLQNAIAKALNSDRKPENPMRGMGIKEKFVPLENDASNNVSASEEDAIAGEKLRHEIMAIEGNDRCADCGSPKPEWASINLGILLCIECSGIHRSLGVQFSKVRSLTLDKWEPEVASIMLDLGNAKVNYIYESPKIFLKHPKPDPDSERSIKENWIRAKFVSKNYVKLPDELANGGFGGEEVHHLFWDACSSTNILDALTYIAYGASVDWSNCNINGETALIHAIKSKNAIVMNFLLQWNCDINLSDKNGYSPLHHAVYNLDLKTVKILLNRRAKVDMKSLDGKTCIDIALEKADPELVMMLRLHKFEIEENSKSSAMTSSGESCEPVSKSEKTSPVAEITGLSRVKAYKNFFDSNARRSSVDDLRNSSNEVLPERKAADDSALNGFNWGSASSISESASALANRIWNSGFSRLPNIHSGKDDDDDDTE